MKPLLILGVGVAAVVVLIAAVLLLGIVELPDFLDVIDIDDDDLDLDDEEAPPGAAYCDYTDMQILDMLESATGKDLDNAAGISFVRALNMQACGSNDETDASISAHYHSLYSSGWYIADDVTDSSSGWSAHRIVWANAPDASATLIRAVLIGSGVTVEMAYGYDTITIVSDGPVLTYGAFAVWLASS